MRVNKWTIYAGLLLFVIGIAVMFFLNNAVMVSIGISLSTGSIVSTITAFLYYYHDKDVILSQIKQAIPDIYVNLRCIMAKIDIILPKELEAQEVRDLGFRRLSAMSELNEECIKSCRIQNYQPIFRKNKLSKSVNDFAKLIDGLTKLRYYIICLEELSLEADIIYKENTIKQIRDESIDRKQIELLELKRDQLYNQTVKTHMYGESLLNKLDEIADVILDSRKESWDKTKLGRQDTIDLIIKETLK